MHEEARRHPLPGRGRALLTGDWSPACVAAIARHYETGLPGGDGPSRGPAADWVLAGPGADPGVVRRLRDAPHPAARLAAADTVALPGFGCDVRIPAAADPADVVAALRLAERGFAVGTGTAPAVPVDQAERFTGREIELLGVLGDGLGNDQIARALNISRRTVEFHLTRIFRKLGVASRMEAIVRARRIGVIA